MNKITLPKPGDRVRVTSRTGGTTFEGTAEYDDEREGYFCVVPDEEHEPLGKGVIVRAGRLVGHTIFIDDWDHDVEILDEDCVRLVPTICFHLDDGDYTIEVLDEKKPAAEAVQPELPF